MSIDPIERSMEQSFAAEQLRRTIHDCEDLDQLRQLALALVDRLAQQQAASRWLAERSSEAENSRMEMLARLINQDAPAQE
ncbi:MAG: hypothetical protein DBW85_05690 [Synechococcus sp. MED-G71]|jgi:hypothetical protein|nr:MAG: hypothetical protein DBW85_05690 [Synechococcus sp. MED-G71]RPF76674.1 MAG: hypothetical protein CBD15_005410 [Synechococcus sp. TMED155]|tara:strand:- start:868 stop:1110 length:243 start_codon:yes stop_codon:yes gene_type:complete